MKLRQMATMTFLRLSLKQEGIPGQLRPFSDFVSSDEPHFLWCDIFPLKMSNQKTC